MSVNLRIVVLVVAAWLFMQPGAVYALDIRGYVDKAVSLIESRQFELARTYLSPALIAPRLSSTERSRAYYLRGFSFMAQDMPVSARKDFNRALEFNPNNAVVLLELGMLHAAGDGTVKDSALALSLFERASNLGYERATFHLGRAYLYGEGVAKNVEAARTELIKAAQQDHVIAMLNLAASYRAPLVANPQPDLALGWYEKAHALDEPAALLSIGFMHMNGELGERDTQAGAAFFQQALDEGLDAAAVHLAYAYLTGDGVAENSDRALALYQQAAAAEVPTSYVGLGHLYEFGLGVSKDLELAETWYEKGATAGDNDALHRLVSFHLRRDSSESWTQALKWSRVAAQTGRVQALNDYAWLLATSKYDKLRNGTLAVDQAVKAVGESPIAPYLDTLAAAYAELGNFELAIVTQQQAIDAITEAESEIQAALEERLQYYERSEPWRE